MPIIIRQPSHCLIIPLKSAVFGERDGFTRIGVEGSTRIVQGRYVEFFPVRVMAAALLHRSLTISVWEAEGFPKAQYSIEGNDHRWYTGEQVTAANIVFERVCGKKHTKSQERLSLYKELGKVMYEPTLKADADTGIITVRGQLVVLEGKTAT